MSIEEENYWGDYTFASTLEGKSAYLVLELDYEDVYVCDIEGDALDTRHEGNIYRWRTGHLSMYSHERLVEMAKEDVDAALEALREGDIERLNANLESLGRTAETFRDEKVHTVSVDVDGAAALYESRKFGSTSTDCEVRAAALEEVQGTFRYLREEDFETLILIADDYADEALKYHAALKGWRELFPWFFKDEDEGYTNDIPSQLIHRYGYTVPPAVIKDALANLTYDDEPIWELWDSALLPASRA